MNLGKLMNNIMFFLTLKKSVAYVESDYTVRQVIEKLEHHHYTAIPMIDENGIYVGTITEGDILWFLKENSEVNFFDLEKYSISSIKRRHDNIAIPISATMESLFEIVVNQSFVPIVDDLNHFIGIITRKAILTYFKDNNK